MKFKELLKTWLDDIDLILDIKTVLIIIGVLLLPLLYFLFADSFDILGLISGYYGVLVFLVMFGYGTVWFEIGSKSKRDEKNNNKLIEETEDKTRDKQKTLPQDVETVIDFTDYYNDLQQKNRNKELTNDVIQDLKNKVTTRKIKGKDTSKLEKRIEHLRKNNLYDKSFKPMKVKSLITIENKKRNELDGNDAIDLDPATHGWRKMIIKLPFKGASIGGSGIFVIAVSESPLTIFFFFLFYMLSLTILILVRYPLVRKMTKYAYILTLNNKCDRIDDFHRWDQTINKKPKLITNIKD